MLGALDELAYFPTLLLGGTFTPIQLSLGALIACVCIVVVVSSFLSRCQPVLELFDRIPLHVIVAIFATILTVDVGVELRE